MNDELDLCSKGIEIHSTTDVLCVFRSLPVKDVDEQDSEDYCCNGRKACSLDDCIQYLHDKVSRGWRKAIISLT